jgi:methylphosphotriester-DNA--protein-cysteine methyltransferase
MKTFRLLGPAGFYASTEPGTLGGNAKTRVYGRLDCRAPRVGLEKGTYQKDRVFFSDAIHAEAAGYRPCGRCMRDSYREVAPDAARRSLRTPNSRWGRSR